MRSNRQRLVVAASTVCALVVATAATAQVQTPSQIKCIASSNGSVAKAAKTQYGNAAACIKLAAAGALVRQTVEECVAADNDGKIATFLRKAEAKDAKLCLPGLVDYAYTSSATATTAGIDSATHTIDDVFDLSAPGAIIGAVGDPDGAKCQAALVKATSSVALNMLTTFNVCKKAGFSDGSIASSVQLQNLCFDAVTQDSSGKIGAAIDKLGDTFTSKCAESAQDDVAQGECATAPDLAACVATAAKCRVCQAFNAADDLTRACDTYDDGEINGSCETTLACDDDDNDGYGTNCELGDDCNDVNANVNPGMPEICNGVDDDCDLTVDDGATCNLGMICESGSCVNPPE